ncbi:MAG TPA: protein kinase, partial [Kofleriaceae bacterium]|nr:protein kinase [Kofleriaceae bacterium]
MLPVDPVGDTVLSTCPHVERLQELVSGRLDPAQEHELEQHLDGCEACRMGVASLVREGRSKAAGTWSLGRYQIGNVLGAGGMGVVYRGWDPALAREVAIKVVKSTDDASLSARLEREARAMARLNHPNVCQVYDVGTDAGELWIAMELIDGTTFRDLLDKARPDRQTVLALLAGIGRGLEAAHAIGMVHRDIKPANVLIDRTGRPVVTDFGLAQHTGGTRSYAMAGTPAYMAPEQLEGMPADARSDQYAFA